jgi:hypothetical protein
MPTFECKQDVGTGALSVVKSTKLVRQCTTSMLHGSSSLGSCARVISAYLFGEALADDEYHY